MSKGDRELIQPATNTNGFEVTLGDIKPMDLDNGTRSGLSRSPTKLMVLNSDKSNAVLICHALTGDQFVASEHPITGRPGWWDDMVGSSKPIDTERFL